ncbi:MAG: ABC transporter ATP-binding protein [Bacillota bacterium]
MAPIIEAIALRKVYPSAAGPVAAVEDISVTVNTGEVFAIMGVSGSGKTTLLSLLSGLERPTSGTVAVAGVDLRSLDEAGLTGLRRQKIGFVFQDFHLIGHLTALENVSVPHELAGTPRREAQKRARELLERVGLGSRTHHFPHQLSGGQKQRVAIARALVNSPAVVFADEPTGNLDRASADSVLALFAELNRDGQTFVVVTHDPSVAEYGDRIIRLEGGRVASEQRGRGTTRTRPGGAMS